MNRFPNSSGTSLNFLAKTIFIQTIRTPRLGGNGVNLRDFLAPLALRLGSCEPTALASQMALVSSFVSLRR